MTKVIIMGMFFNKDSVPNFGSLYAVKIGSGSIKDVNEYGGEDESDAAYLDNITNAACGSTCLFSNGSIYRCEPSGWKKFGEVTGNANVTDTSSLHLSPLGINGLMNLDFEPDLPEEITVSEGDDITLEAPENIATGETKENEVI